MKFDGTHWGLLGSTAFSGGSTQYTSITIDLLNRVYVAYEDISLGYRLTVMTYTAGSWSVVGYPGVSAGGTAYSTITTDNTGNVFVAYQDWNSSYRATVLRFDTIWHIVAYPGFSRGWATWTSIAIDGTGAPCVAYQDANDSNKLTVMRFNVVDTTWDTVGRQGFSEGVAQYPTLAFDHTGAAYVAFSDWNRGSHATVMKYSGGSWGTVGIEGFSNGEADYTSIAIDPAGTPYIAYKDVAESNKVIVAKYTAVPVDTGRRKMCLFGLDTLANPIPSGVWSSSNTFVARVGSTTGIVTGINLGTATISYTILGTPATMEVTVNDCSAEGVTVNNSSSHALSVFPNPSQGSFTLNISSPQTESAMIVLTNMLGEKVKELALTTNTNTEVQLNTPPGIYFLSATAGGWQQNVKIELLK